MIDISILDTKDPVALIFQIALPQCVPLLLSFCGVCGPVHFNDDLELSTKEIHEVVTDRCLPNEP